MLVMEEPGADVITERTKSQDVKCQKIHAHVQIIS